MLNKHALSIAATLAGMAAMGPANASPVTYDFTGGYVTLSADLGGTDYLAPGQTIPLTGTQVTFDSSTMSLGSFQFADAGPSTVALTGAYSGLFITLANVVVGPGSGYSTFSASGSNPYNFTVGPVVANGTYAWSGIETSAPTSFSASNPVLAGEISLTGSDWLQLTGITLGTFTVNGQTGTLKADIVFDGAPVPLPSAIWLLLSGLGAIGVPFLRRRPTGATSYEGLSWDSQ